MRRYCCYYKYYFFFLITVQYFFHSIHKCFGEHVYINNRSRYPLISFVPGSIGDSVGRNSLYYYGLFTKNKSKTVYSSSKSKNNRSTKKNIDKSNHNGKKKGSLQPKKVDSITDDKMLNGASSANDQKKKISSALAIPPSGTGNDFVRPSKASISKMVSSNGISEKDETSKSLSSSTSSIYLTRAELDQILNERGLSSSSSPSSLSSKNRFEKGNDAKLSQKQTKMEKGKVAFPQATKLTPTHLQRGTIVSSSLFFALVGITIYPNLWLISALFGAYYGQTIPIEQDEDGNVDSSSLLLHQMVLQNFGTRLASAYLLVKDALEGLWFLYRTGQLSLDYYKQYAQLDSKFQVTKKIDAWNARFVEGKRAFDEWERQHEVSRKVLATLRTAWLVEEESSKKRKKSKYRLLRYIQSIPQYIRILYKKYVAPIQWNKLGDQTEQRIIAAGVAVIIVQAIHILFLSSPQITTLLAATIAAMAYPNYYFFTVSMDDNNNDFSQKKEESSTIMSNSQAPFWNEWFSIPTASKSNRKKKKKTSLVPASNFHYYQQSDGTKTWYRTGKSLFQRKSSSVKKVEPKWKSWRKTNNSKRT